MKRCPCCGRVHTGICGVPTGVTLGFGARVGSIGVGENRPRQEIRQAILPRKTVLKRQGKQRLREALDWGEREKEKVLEMLKVIPPEMKEDYDMSLERLDKLETALRQIKLRLE